MTLKQIMNKPVSYWYDLYHAMETETYNCQVFYGSYKVQVSIRKTTNIVTMEDERDIVVYVWYRDNKGVDHPECIMTAEKVKGDENIRLAINKGEFEPFNRRIKNG